MREIEKRIQEKRAIEATKKKLMGFNGKLGCIVRNLGQPLIAQTEGGGLHEYGPTLGTDWLYEDDTPLEKVRTADELARKLPTTQMLDELGNPIPNPEGKEWREFGDRIGYTTDQIGWHFDGLSRGMHLEIKYEDANKLLIVHYKGYEVYKEVAGELLAYAPHQEWEGKIDQLYVVAKKLDDQNKRQDRKEEIQEAKHMKDSWWDKTRKKWGL